MKIKSLFIGLYFIFSGIIASAQQDAQFSQYLFNGLYINPAYSGYKGDLYLNCVYRAQWAGMTGAPQTFAVSADGAVHDNKVGLGVLMSKDKIGAEIFNTVYANYSYRLQMGRDEHSRLAFGVGAGVLQQEIDGSALNALDAGDRYIPEGVRSTAIPEVRAGILFSNDYLFAGFSADHLLSNMISKPLNDDYLLRPVPHFYFTTGALAALNSDIKMRPSVMLKDDGNGPTCLDINTFFLLNERFWFGGSYRTAVPLYNKPHLQKDLQYSDGIAAIIEFVSDKFRIGYSFDYSLARFSDFSYGTHEISLGIFIRRERLTPLSAKCFF